MKPDKYQAERVKEVAKDFSAPAEVPFSMASVPKCKIEVLSPVDDTTAKAIGSMMIYRTIGEAWLNLCQGCVRDGREFTITRGSYVGQHRKQFDTVAFTITHPETRPLGFEHDGLAISDDKSIEKYFADYLINPDLAPGEQYTYASRMAPHLEAIAEMLRVTPGTNQATLEVARPEDVLLADPPCLRMLSWKVTGLKLQLSSFWRSWDLFSGLPTNLGGLQLLNELMAEWAEVRPGPLFCTSDGAHVYDHNWKMVG